MMRSKRSITFIPQFNRLVLDMQLDLVGVELEMGVHSAGGYALQEPTPQVYIGGQAPYDRGLASEFQSDPFQWTKHLVSPSLVRLDSTEAVVT